MSVRAANDTCKRQARHFAVVCLLSRPRGIAWRALLGEDSLQCNESDNASGAQTERRGGAGPVGGLLAVRTSPAVSFHHGGAEKTRKPSCFLSVPLRLRG